MYLLFVMSFPNSYCSNLDGTCCQTIQHPGCVWDVKFLPNGDLITACSDGVARIWTKIATRFASAEELTAYEDQVSARISKT
jgi:phospholipase A-2-activating protein